MALIFLIVRVHVVRQKLKLEYIDRKNVSQLFHTTNDILRSLSLAQFPLKRRNAPILRQLVSTHMRLSGTDGLRGDALYDLVRLFVYERDSD